MASRFRRTALARPACTEYKESVAKTLGAVTIGQSPRVDIIPELRAFLGGDVEIIEAGALDGISGGSVGALAPKPGDEVLVTRMTDGTGVRVASRHIEPLLQRRFEELEGQVGVFLLLCTGTFAPFRSSRPILYPERIIFGMVRAVAPGSHVGVITPDLQQVPTQRARWLEVVPKVTVVPHSPYQKDASIVAAAQRLTEANVDLVVLDSLGYSLAMKDAVRGETGRPVLLPRSVLARVAQEIL
ncbi:MAG: AroM family protein [bacterium]